MFAPVEPVHAQRPVTGLIASAVNPQDNARWQNGMAWRSELCPTARNFDPCGSEFTDPVGDGGEDIIYYRPPAYRVDDECSTRSGEPDQGRLTRKSDAIASYMVARELERGAFTQVAPYETPFGGVDITNAYLAMPEGTVVAGEWEPLAGLGAIEEAARDRMLGGDPFIHVSTELVPLIAPALQREGNLLRTFTGARVVADAGYGGLGPDVPATSEVQTVTITGAPTGGVFTLTFDTQETGDIPFNAVGATVQTALNASPNLDGVTVTGAAGGPYTVTFPADMGNVPTMTADGSGLTGGTAPAVGVVVTTPGVDQAPTAGLWIYATGPVQVRLGDTTVHRDVEWRANRRYGTADRLFAATFDPCTLHALAVVDPAPTP
jgi:hypothetical protein